MIMSATKKSKAVKNAAAEPKAQSDIQGPLVGNEHFVMPSTVTEVQVTYQRVVDSGEREEFMHWSAKIVEGYEGNVELFLKRARSDDISDVRFSAHLNFYHMEELVCLRDMLTTLVAQSREGPPGFAVDLGTGRTEKIGQRKGLLPTERASK